MCSANAINAVLLCGGFKEKKENSGNSEITPSRGKENFCVYWKANKKIPTPTPTTKTEELTLSKNQHTTDRKAALK